MSANRLASLEKARIMIALMRREGVPADCIQSLMETRFDRPWYRHLVERRNFNPRIVEFACRRPTHESVPAGRFASLLTNLLDNPSQVWESEFECLTPSDRCPLHALYILDDLGALADLYERVYGPLLGALLFRLRRRTS